MSVELNEVQKVLIDKIAKENGFNNYKVITSKGSKKGDGNLGVLTRVTIKNEEKTLELLLKSVYQNEGAENTNDLRPAYLREICFYENVFNQFKKYQEDHNVADIFDNYAKMYGSSIVEKNECLVMENLKLEGYKMVNKQQTMNPEHISAVLKGYAKFHGTCMAMKHKDPALFENLTKDVSRSIWDIEFGSDKDKFDMYVTYTMSMVYKIVEDDPVLTEFLKAIELNMSNMFFNLREDPEYLISLIHCDCWCNNILFRYEDSNNKRPADVKFIDWQMAHLFSPIFDYCYFFLLHSSKEILDDYKIYLKIYYDKLSQQFRSFNCDPDEIFPYSRFEKHIDYFMALGLFVCFSQLKAMLIDDEIYQERVRNLIVFVKENNFVKK